MIAYRCQMCFSSKVFFFIALSSLPDKKETANETVKYNAKQKEKRKRKKYQNKRKQQKISRYLKHALDV